MFDRGLFLSSHAIRRQLAAMPQDLYLVRLIHHATRKAFPGERLWTAAQLGQQSTVQFLRIRNREEFIFSPMLITGTPATSSWIWITAIQPHSNGCA